MQRYKIKYKKNNFFSFFFSFFLSSIFCIRIKLWNRESVQLWFLTDLHVLGRSKSYFINFSKCLLVQYDTNFMAALAQKFMNGIT